MNEVWIKLHKKFLDWKWYKNKNTKILFIHCLLKANWKDGFYQDVEVKRGSFVTGRKQLSKELGLTEQEIRTAINHLKSTNEITINSTNNFSIISINNYDKYQSINQVLNQRATNEQPQYKNIDTSYTTSINNIERILGRTLNPVEYELINCWLENYEWKKIEYALKETMVARANNLRYTNAILENIKNKNIEELNNSKEEESEYVEIPDYDWLNENN